MLDYTFVLLFSVTSFLRVFCAYNVHTYAYTKIFFNKQIYFIVIIKNVGLSL